MGNPIFNEQPHINVALPDAGYRILILFRYWNIIEYWFRAAPNSIVVGSTTAGADGNISRISLPGGLTTNISGICVFYPDRKPTQKVGIVPDVEVHPTAEGLREGRDEVLEAAIRQIIGVETSDKEIIMSRYR